MINNNIVNIYKVILKDKCCAIQNYNEITIYGNFYTYIYKYYAFDGLFTLINMTFARNSYDAWEVEK